MKTPGLQLGADCVNELPSGAATVRGRKNVERTEFRIEAIHGFARRSTRGESDDAAIAFARDEYDQIAATHGLLPLCGAIGDRSTVDALLRNASGICPVP